MSKKQVEAWLVLKAVRSKYSTYPPSSPHRGARTVHKVTATAVRQSKPSTVGKDEIAFKINIEVDEDWFNDPVASVNVVLPSPPAAPPVPVTVDMPVKGRSQSPAAAVIPPRTP